MRRNETIVAYGASWGPLTLLPWRLTLRMACPRAGYGALHLDGMLSACVVWGALQGAPLADTPDPYDIPLPLAALWRDPGGLPLWAVTDLAPIGPHATARSTWTRKQTPPRLMRDRTDGQATVLRATQGPYKDMQIPLPTEITAAYTCDLCGDGEVVAELLGLLSHVGKKRSQGHGDILDWRLDPIDSFSLLDAEGALRRVIPSAAVGRDDGQWLSWTPPYWHPGCHEACLPVGTVCAAAGEWEALG